METPKFEKIIAMYRDALTVQDACNLSGVVSSFARHMHTMVEMGLDTDARNHHAVSILFSSKIASLTGSETLTAFHEAYDIASNKVERFEALNQVEAEGVTT